MARLALLICDTPIALLDTYGDYNVIYRTHLRASLDAIEGDKPSQFTLDGYDVVKGVYPADDAHYDGVVITGSGASHDPRTGGGAPLTTV
jgi:hypothetical protein